MKSSVRNKEISVQLTAKRPLSIEELTEKELAALLEKADSEIDNGIYINGESFKNKLEKDLGI